MTDRDKTRTMTICFHGIGEPRPSLEPGEDRFWITTDQFGEILDVIADHDDAVTITFDDGNESDHRHALTEVLGRSLEAEFYVVAGRIGQPGSLSRTQLRELVEANMVVGNHGFTHMGWREARNTVGLDTEIASAGRTIAEIVGQPVTRAACPRGSYDRRVLRYLRDAGYERVYTVDEGTTAPGAWLRHRYTVTRFDTAETIARRLRNPDGTRLQNARRRLRQVAKRWR